jgi:drug/metabolite transporter (DMT)-like permease
MHVEQGIERALSSREGFGVILMSSVSFGLMAVMVRIAARSMPATQIAFVRFVGSLVILLIVGGGRGLTPQPGNLGRLVLRGLIGSTAIVLYFIGIWGAGAGLATLLQNAYPLFAALFASSMLGEPVPGRLVAALLLDVAGLAMVIGPDLHAGSVVTLGALSASCAAVLSGGAVVAARHLRRTENALLITTYFMAVGAVVTAPALLAGVPVVSATLALALLGVVVTSVAGQWMLHHGLGYTSAAQGSLIAATSVVTATAIETTFLGQPPSPHAIAGGGLVLLAIALAVRGD